ncbi:hypothetical protein Droror1_Dr00023988 [Drosera rotundifolia]
MATTLPLQSSNISNTNVAAVDDTVEDTQSQWRLQSKDDGTSRLRNGNSRLRNGNTRLENSGSNAMAMFGNFRFNVVVLTVLVLTILAVNYQPDGHLFRLSDMVTIFLTSTSNAMFKSDNTVKTLGDQVILDSDGTEDSDASPAAQPPHHSPLPITTLPSPIMLKYMMTDEQRPHQKNVHGAR